MLNKQTPVTFVFESQSNGCAVNTDFVLVVIFSFLVSYNYGVVVCAPWAC